MSEEKFKKLANARVNNAIKYLRLTGNLANKSNYKYTKKQADQIIKTLKAELSELEKKFTNPIGGRGHKEFKIE